MKQVNRLLELKRISEDIVRTYKDLSILLPLKVEGTCNFFGLENIYLYNFDIKFVEDSNSTFVLNSQFSAIDKVDFLLLSRRDAEIESIVMDKLEEIMKKSTNLLTYINEVVEKRKTNPNIDIFEQLSADELHQKITNEFLKLLAVVNLQTSSSINDAINQSIAN
jgi:polyribonucleotide nucleotidyltransferase